LDIQLLETRRVEEETKKRKASKSIVENKAIQKKRTAPEGLDIQLLETTRIW
jgi:hypothetical protein